MYDSDSFTPAKRWSTRPRLKDFDYVGAYAYHLVFNTAAHKRTLVGAVANGAVEATERAATATAFELLAYTVMPDHVHLLVQGADGLGECCAPSAAMQAAAGIPLQA